MATNKVFQFYDGMGIPISQRNMPLPPYERFIGLDDPAGYIAGTGLRDAVNVSLTLGLPLLITGEPGTGKTQLARSIAYELELYPPLIFNAKTTSIAKDLFYRYDALRHFQDVNIRHDGTNEVKKVSTDDYITYEALGLAILLTLDLNDAASFLPKEWLERKLPTRSVVLIDEIDKAPRDFPNDILSEIEDLSFVVKETGRKFAARESLRPILVLTSNSEKNLPDAFLRRCIFYHIPFPNKSELRNIIRRRLNLSSEFVSNALDNALEHFEQLRNLALKKKPATAELLSWIKLLEVMQIDISNLRIDQVEALALSYSILAKNKDDLDVIKQFGVKK